jgi:hypothetical protein
MHDEFFIFFWCDYGNRCTTNTGLIRSSLYLFSLVDSVAETGAEGVERKLGSLKEH